MNEHPDRQEDDADHGPNAGHTVRIEVRPAAVPPTHTHVPDSLAREYIVLEKIGDGGMGVVYLGQDRKLGRYVAIKRLRQEGHTPVLQARLFQEAKTIAALRHPHIVHVYTMGDDDEGPYIVMEYIPGPAEFSPGKTPAAPFALDDRVNREGPLSLPEALELLIKICRAVDYAHSCGIVHRDLKPSNILFDESGEPRIVDFGIARVLAPGQAHMTLPGEKMLSLGYGAPEQERDASDTDTRADVYGLGAVFYFSITGQNPRYFRADDVPEAVRMAVVKALEPQRDKRWSTVREFLDCLLTVKTPTTIDLPSVKRTWRCKWCDTVNPTAVRYCGKCGWDGGATCLECGAEMRVGIPFCGHCGADARQYEKAERLLQSCRKAFERKDYRSAIEQAGAVSEFTPGGPGGRYIAGEIVGLRKLAEQSLLRREQLREQVAASLASQEYERAQQSIAEYNTLASDGAFDEDLRRIPTLIAQRDVARALGLVEAGQWRKARAIQRRLPAATVASIPDAPRLARRIRMHYRAAAARNAVLFAAVLLAYYILAAPALQAGNGPAAGLFAPAMAVYRHPALTPLLGSYAARWAPPEDPSDTEQPTPGPGKPPIRVIPADVDVALLRHGNALAAIEAKLDSDMQDTPPLYIEELNQLRVRLQKAGDYEGWDTVGREIERFQTHYDINPTDVSTTLPELAVIQRKFMARVDTLMQARSTEIEKARHTVLEQLKQIRAGYTRQGKMEEARMADQEIDRLEAELQAEQASRTGSPPEAQPPETAAP